MLHLAFRLRKKNDIERVLKKGERVTDSFFRVIILKNGLSTGRFCIIIPKKTAKKAHMRNKVKRRVSEILRRNYAVIPKGYDVVILIFPPALEKPSHALAEHLTGIFHRSSSYHQ